jgi:hypothetical protein
VTPPTTFDDHPAKDAAAMSMIRTIHHAHIFCGVAGKRLTYKQLIH